MAANTAGRASRAGAGHPGLLDHRYRVRSNDQCRSGEPEVRSGHREVRRLSDVIVHALLTHVLTMGTVRAGAGRHQRRGDHDDHRRQPERYGTSGLHCA
ncbi:hypothetical protein [Methylorubrum sp. SL192]|uniref:hypothetical protein n=1 Tax=Methylorubrum sp. SL192 TaxID=2995167 RepID=UPI002272F709|nr:hypothetical protein [Methylorubrum sp. SL192]MCY1642508.1 hypothetical protein [Methylorubrum sp. SL192]